MGRKNASAEVGEGSETAEDELEGLETAAIVERADGFFGVEGMSEDTYYQDRATAERVSRNMAVQKRARLNGRD